jgi:prepilin-type N-terminal cleavage/methylation domain-containing protein
MTRVTRSESGLTLIELLVTMVILGVLSTMIVSLFANVTQTLTRDRSATDSTNVAAIGMNEVTRVIRAGTQLPKYQQTVDDPVFVLAGREDMTLYAYLDTDSANPKPVKIRFYLNAARELVEERWAAVTTANPSYWSFATASYSSRVIARTVTTYDASIPDAKYVFTYYDKSGAVLTPPAAGFTSFADIREIAAVQVTMRVQADITARAAPVTIQNTVGIPNLGVARVGP